MKPGGVNTILLIARDRLVRADFRPGREKAAVRLDEERRPAADDLPSLVEAALRLGSGRAGRTWILTSEIWTQTLSLPPASVAGLSPEEITRALGFEAEPFSGIGAMEAAAASVPTADEGGQRSYWLTQLPAAQLEQIEYIVQQAGGRLTGMCHPGGLPRPLCAPVPEHGAWRRIELWPNSILCVAGGAKRQPAVSVRNTDPKPGRWEASVQPWQADEAAPALVESLHASSAVAFDELTEEHRLSLEDAGSLEQFLRIWADELAAPHGAVPRVVPPRRPMPAARRYAIAAAMGLLTLAACVALHLTLEAHRGRMVADTAKLNEPIQRLKQMKGEADKLQARRDELKKSCQKLETDLAHYRQVVQTHRQCMASLLAVLARSVPPQMVIQKIDGTEDEIVLHGLCLQVEPADQLARALAEVLGPQGWLVQPPSRQSRETLAGGGPWEFDVSIRDAASKPSGQSADASARPGRRHEKQP